MNLLLDLLARVGDLLAFFGLLAAMAAATWGCDRGNAEVRHGAKDADID